MKTPLKFNWNDSIKILNEKVFVKEFVKNEEIIKNNKFYQVDFEKSMDNIIKHISGLNDIIYAGKSKLFYEDREGEGFNYDNVIETKFIKKKNNFKLEFNVEKIVKSLRWDPVEDYFSEIKILDIYCFNKDKKKSLKEMIEYTNGYKYKNNETYIFDTIDPIILIPYKGWIDKIVIEGIINIKPKHFIEAKINDIKHELKLKSFNLDNYDGKISNLYVDDGMGYSEDKKITKKVEIKDDKSFEIEYDLSEYGRIERLRFDPLENRICRLKLETTFYLDESSSEKIIEMSNVSYNGELDSGGYISFDTLDPQLYFDVKDYVKTIKFQGVCEVAPIGEFERIKHKNELDNTKNELDNTKNELDNTKNELDNTRMNSITQRMNSITQRMNSITQRMNSITQRMNSITQRMNSITQRMNSITQKMNLTG